MTSPTNRTPISPNDARFPSIYRRFAIARLPYAKAVADIENLVATNTKFQHFVLQHLEFRKILNSSSYEGLNLQSFGKLCVDLYERNMPSASHWQRTINSMLTTPISQSSWDSMINAFHSNPNLNNMRAQLDTLIPEMHTAFLDYDTAKEALKTELKMARNDLALR